MEWKIQISICTAHRWLTLTESLETGVILLHAHVCELTFCLWVVLVACSRESGERGDPGAEQWFEGPL